MVMEHEFDKEMDSLLRGFGRRAEGRRSVPSGEHADADQLAAFLDGALPATARANLIAHTANCDVCRAVFAAAVDLHEASVQADVSVAAPAVEPKRRWRFLGMPAFAAALSGLLVVAFAGLIAVRYLSQADESNIVAQKSAGEGARPASAPETSANASVYSNQIPLPEENAQANSNAAATANASRRVENAPTIAPRSFAETPDDKADQDELAKRDTEMTTQPKAVASEPSVAAAPKPEKKDLSPDLQVDGASGKENVWVLDGREVNNRQAKDAPARAKAAPPSAADGALRSQVASPTTTRTVSGKKFTQREGIWYDSAYKGGKTTDRAKRCDTCGTMEPALERIITALPGTVVVVWKGKNLKFY